MRSRFFLGEVADHVLRSNGDYYTEDLMSLIPDNLLDTEFTTNNTQRLSDNLDKLRFKKEEELTAMLSEKETLSEVLNSPLNTLIRKKERKRKEVKFLFNVASTLLHWK